MNKFCKLCDGRLDFSKFLIDVESSSSPNINFHGSMSNCNKNNAFRFCPACGTRLTKENFGGDDVFNDDGVEKNWVNNS